MRFTWQKMLTFLTLAFLIIAFFALGLGRYFTFDQLRASKHELLVYYNDHQLLTALMSPRR